MPINDHRNAKIGTKITQSKRDVIANFVNIIRRNYVICPSSSYSFIRADASINTIVNEMQENPFFKSYQ